MGPRYQIGQKVIVNPANVPESSLRESELSQYIGKTGEIKDLYWIALDRGINLFYVYTIAMDNEKKDLVLHEDELQEILV